MKCMVVFPRLVQLLLIIGLSFNTYSQTLEDLKGKWEGVHYYGDTTRLYNGTLIVRASTIDSTKMILTIEKLEQGTFAGHLREHFYSDPKGAYFTANVSGTVNNDTVHFKAFEIRENRFPPGNRWCKPKAIGFIVKHDTFFALNIAFESTLTCTVGPAILERDIVDNTKNAERVAHEKIEVKKPAVVIANPKLRDSLSIVEKFNTRNRLVASTITVQSDSIQVRFVDNGLIDGDSISVFVDGVLHTPHIRLSTKAFTMNIKFEDKKEVELAMFAENLGLIPPNTALMQIRDGINMHQARMSSDDKSSAVIKIRRR